MDIGKAYREIVRVDVSDLRAALTVLSDVEWDARPIRRASLAGGAHDVASSIVLRHEWEPGNSKRGFQTLQESLLDWARRNGRDGRPMLPLMQERNSETFVYTFPDWFRWQASVLPVISEVIQNLVAQPRGVLTRALFVRLKSGAVIPRHTDGQDLAKRCHRIHVAITDNPECIYTSGQERFSMEPGVAYDFNNRWEHGVENRGASDRINLMLEYLPDPSWIYPAPIFFNNAAYDATAAA